VLALLLRAAGQPLVRPEYVAGPQNRTAPDIHNWWLTGRGQNRDRPDRPSLMMPIFQAPVQPAGRISAASSLLLRRARHAVVQQLLCIVEQGR
jgi:hypothetical protein